MQFKRNNSKKPASRASHFFLTCVHGMGHILKSFNNHFPQNRLPVSEVVMEKNLLDIMRSASFLLEEDFLCYCFGTLTI